MGGQTEPQCETTLDDRGQGANSVCANTSCCPYPFADADGDGDVDQLDFGAWQVCYDPTTVAPGCECFNHNGDNAVDNTDLEAFANCWSRPNIPALAPPAGCSP